MRDIKILQVILFITIFLSQTGKLAAGNLTCSGRTTLEQLASCIMTQMPKADSNGFVAPNSAEQSDWKSVVNQMMQGSCNISIPSSLNGIVQVTTFNDTQKSRSYCVLMEILDANNNGIVDRGWGTFIVYSAALRELSHQASHPLSDSTTELQAVTLFKNTDSRSYLVAGARRDANAVTSPCQSSYESADVAHNVMNMFQATNQQLMLFYGSTTWHAIQWHGMAVDTCPDTDVYLTHGMISAPNSTDKIVGLKQNLLKYHPSWKIDLPGSSSCSLNGTTNVQGRLINGVSANSVCGTAASAYTGRFLHIEQDSGFRNPADWVSAIQDTWLTQPPTTIPMPPTGFTALAGKKKVTLSWNVSQGATSYKIRRSTTSGGPYSIIANGVTATSFVNSGLSSGKTYYYVVTAANSAGESNFSNQVSAKPR